ncbi:microspherule protein 1-like isoform X1 [Rhopilema esculentum]|uniref:microspherule protein 1-like isoform X1 n=1 Tax=Rhopilema esculentum TaxID=499914 RepID=UPI0031DC7F2E
MSDINPTGSSPEDASFSFNRLPGPDGLRRSSSRSIKRKKFDDEVVDTSNPFKRMPSSRRSSESSQPDQKPSPLAKKVSRQSSALKKKSKRVKPQPVPSDFGRWRPTDDLALITAVQQTNDLNAVHLGVKFSCHFTLREVQERWYALLYDPVVSKLSQQAMKQLPTDVIQGIQSSALWSKEEELVLVDIASNSNPNLQRFENLFEENQSIFHKSRTAKALLNHWLLMKHYQLLSDQSARSSETDVNLHDMESRLNDDEILESKDEMLDQELFSVDRRQKRELKRLEEEIPQWQVIVDEMIGSGSSVSEFDSQTLAVLRGRVVRYLMRSKEITFGRNTSDTRVDIDFSLEGPTWKISRRHGMIKMTNDGKFMLHNQGRRPVFINGAPVVAGSSIQLPHNSALEICGLKFLFLINPDLKRVKEAKQESLLRKERAAEGNTT